MSIAIRDKYGKDAKLTRAQINEFIVPLFETDADGNLIYLTEQSHKDSCDVNNIVSKYDQTGLVAHVQKFEGSYADVTGADFTRMMNRVVEVQQKFLEFPSAIRNRFNNDPAQFLSFFEDPKNKDEAIKLGVIRNDWIDGKNGFGASAKSGERVVDPKAGGQVAPVAPVVPGDDVKK